MYNIIQLIYGVLFFVKTAHANTVSASSDCDDCEGTVYNLLAGCPEFAQDSNYQAQENRGIGAFSGDGLSGCCGGSINMAISGGDILAVQRSGDQTGSCFTFKVQQAGQIPYSIEVPDDCDDCSVTVYHIVGDPPNYNGRSWTDSSIWAGIGESTSPSSPLSGEWGNVGKSGILDVAQGDNIGLCGHRNSGSSIHAFKITQIGCFIGSTEPITPPPRPAAPLQPFVFPDNPTQRAVCRELTDADACRANHECSWNVFQGMCNEFSHQPLFNGCHQCRVPYRVRAKTWWAEGVGRGGGYGHVLGIVKEDGSYWILGNFGSTAFVGAPKSAAWIKSYPTTFGEFEEVFSDGVLAASSGGHHMAVLKQDGSVWTMGVQDNGFAGSDDFQQVLDSGVTSVSSGTWATLAVKDGNLWGLGQLHGNGGNTVRGDFAEILTGGVTASCAGAYHCMAVKDGGLWGYGSNNNGQVGDGTQQSVDEWKEVMSGDDIADVKCGFYFTLVLKTDGSLWGAGDGGSGQLGPDLGANNPDFVHLLDEVIAFSAGLTHSVVLKQDGSVWGAGSHSHFGSTGSGREWTQTFVGNTAVNVGANGDNTYVWKDDGTVWSAGSNDWGQRAQPSGSTPPVEFTDTGFRQF